MNYAVGLEYGYSLPVARCLNLDFVIGVGYWGGEYQTYDPADGHYVWKETRRRHWFGPRKRKSPSCADRPGELQQGERRQTMKKIKLFHTVAMAAFLAAVTSCEHKDLCYEHPHPARDQGRFRLA